MSRPVVFSNPVVVEPVAVAGVDPAVPEVERNPHGPLGEAVEWKQLGVDVVVALADLAVAPRFVRFGVCEKCVSQNVGSLGCLASSIERRTRPEVAVALVPGAPARSRPSLPWGATGERSSLRPLRRRRRFVETTTGLRRGNETLVAQHRTNSSLQTRAAVGGMFAGDRRADIRLRTMDYSRRAASIQETNDSPAPSPTADPTPGDHPITPNNKVPASAEGTATISAMKKRLTP